MNCMQIVDSEQTVQTHTFAQQVQPSRQRSRLHYICQTRQECNRFSCSHRLQHRLDCIVILSAQSSCGSRSWEETFEILLQKTVSEHVTRIELSINTFHFEVSLLQFLLQPTMPDIQMFHSSDASLVLWQHRRHCAGQSEEAPFHRTQYCTASAWPLSTLRSCS